MFGVKTMATKFEIEKFNGRNFSLWKLKIRAILRKDNCLDAIDGRPADITDEKWKKLQDLSLNTRRVQLPLSLINRRILTNTN